MCGSSNAHNRVKEKASIVDRYMCHTENAQVFVLFCGRSWFMIAGFCGVPFSFFVYVCVYVCIFKKERSVYVWKLVWRL